MAMLLDEPEGRLQNAKIRKLPVIHVQTGSGMPSLACPCHAGVLGRFFHSLGISSDDLLHRGLHGGVK